MTLEQIKNKQAQLNSKLLFLLEEQRTVVSRITGVELSLNETISKEPLGLLDEISIKQTFTDTLIKELTTISNTLISNTYLPAEDIPVEVG